MLLGGRCRIKVWRDGDEQSRIGKPMSFRADVREPGLRAETIRFLLADENSLFVRVGSDPEMKTVLSDGGATGKSLQDSGPIYTEARKRRQNGTREKSGSFDRMGTGV